MPCRQVLSQVRCITHYLQTSSKALLTDNDQVLCWFLRADNYIDSTVLWVNPCLQKRLPCKFTFQVYFASLRNAYTIWQQFSQFTLDSKFPHFSKRNHIFRYSEDWVPKTCYKPTFYQAQRYEFPHKCWALIPWQLTWLGPSSTGRGNNMKWAAQRAGSKAWQEVKIWSF